MVEAKVAVANCSTSTNKEDNDNKDGIGQKDAQELLESDLSCAICQDIYINPLILNCSHSFCKFCVYQWLSKKTGCPQCRLAVSFQAENLALRNIINRMVQKTSQQFQNNRSTSIAQRLKEEEKLESNGTTKLMPWAKVDNISTYGMRPRTSRYRMVQGTNPSNRRSLATSSIIRPNFSLFNLSEEEVDVLPGDDTITIDSDDESDDDEDVVDDEGDDEDDDESDESEGEIFSRRSRTSRLPRHNWLGWSDLSELFSANIEDSEVDEDWEDHIEQESDSDSVSSQDDAFEIDVIENDDVNTDMDLSQESSDETSDDDDDDDDENELEIDGDGSPVYYSSSSSDSSYDRVDDTIVMSDDSSDDDVDASEVESDRYDDTDTTIEYATSDEESDS